MIKDILYTGLGGALLLKERVDEEIEKLQENGKLSKDDADAFLEKLQTRGEKEEKKFKSHIKESLKEVIHEMGLATKKDIKALKKKLKKRLKDK
jgi:polyhydroxyalkanoate synthesis regulator phasin